MGRVLLASLAESEAAERLTASPRVARTPHTITNPAQILDALRTVRRSGYALIDQEVELGLRSIAVPVLNVRGATVAALNVDVAARQASVSDLVGLYLDAMLGIQSELKAVLR